VSLFGVRHHPLWALWPTEVRLPSFAGATGWLNSSPLTPADLLGKVVLVDFWTYTCINWLRTLGYVRAWTEKYRDQGLVVVGVHTPEFPFEQDVDNVREAARDMRVEYPVAVDSDMAIWRAFANRYWPAIYLADAQGRIRHHQFGEGEYDKCEWAIQMLLRDAGRDDIDDDLVSIVHDGFEAQADWNNLQSRETYLGHEQAQNFSSPGGADPDRPRIYVTPERLWLNEWALSGDWTVGERACMLNRAAGQIVFRFHARDVHLVMGPSAGATSVPFRVLIDGEAPGPANGLDVDELGEGTVIRPRLYQLVRQREPITDRTIEITFLAPRVEAYVFTFG
jgi:thiol-disulfide isomerase/thioredoxin